MGLAEPFTLPCGQVLPNRLAKAAMAEALADEGHHADGRLIRLYRRWATGGTGLFITGNVMIDARALGEHGDVVVEDESGLGALAAWAVAAKSGGARVWVQLNHPGRQSLSPEPVAPSAVPLQMSLNVFKTPRALTEGEIHDLIRRFARSAALVKQAGFDGVELHGAHGYLISQFLSPRTNRRTDAWGGSPEKRMRFLLEVVKAVREAVGAGFPVGVKLNSADFQRGGFSEEESLAVAAALDAAGVDLLEISGGTYESAAMTGIGSERSRDREAYFLAYAERVREQVGVPLMVTGGFRSRSGMEAALASGALDVVGLARPLAVDPDASKRLLAGEADGVPDVTPRVGIPDFDRLLQVMWFQQQLHRMARGQEPDARLNPWIALGTAFWSMGFELFRPKRGS